MALEQALKKWILSCALLIMSGFALACEDCADDYYVCTSQISASELQTFEYERTCKYPTMTEGNARIYCECEAALQSCEG